MSTPPLPPPPAPGPPPGKFVPLPVVFPVQSQVVQLGRNHPPSPGLCLPPPGTSEADEEDVDPSNPPPPDCPVCMAPLVEGELSKLKGCGHTFHEACLRSWSRERARVGKKATCPCCRESYNPCKHVFQECCTICVRTRGFDDQPVVRVSAGKGCLPLERGGGGTGSWIATLFLKVPKFMPSMRHAGGGGRGGRAASI